MFVLTKFRHSVRLDPSEWKRALPEAVTDAVNRSMANTVVHNVGLFVSVFDLLEIGDSFLLHDGCSHTAVTFRALVFRPFVEEVLVGRIKSCSQQTGVAVTLGFFDDIVIPPEALQHPSRFDENEQVWVWEYPTEEGDHHDMYMDIGEEIRFRVTSETFVDTSPCTEPKAEPPTQSGESVGGDKGPGAATTTVADIVEHQEEKKIPYLIQASVNEPGLGLLSWWKS